MTVWDAMIGQPEAVETLRRAAEAGRAIARGQNAEVTALSHAWLITGPPGSGRSVAAKCLAAALQCTGEPVGCGECAGCRTTMAGTNPDVQIHATEFKQYLRESVTEWVDHAYDAPSGGLWKVTLVEDADRIRDPATAVLLKPIEEPPERGIWILAAPSAQEVMVTIRSRCRRLTLRTPSAPDVAAYIADQDAVTYEDAFHAAVLAQSHVGYARALLRKPELRERFRAVFELPLRAASPSDAVVAAGRMHALLKEMAEEQTKERDSKERAELLKVLGVTNPKRVPPAARPQLRALEEDQRRRASRALADAIDRALTDLLSFFRDVLARQLGAQTQIVNVDLEELVEQYAASSRPEATMARVAAVEKSRKRNLTSASPLLLLESLALSVVDPITNEAQQAETMVP